MATEVVLLDRMRDLEIRESSNTDIRIECLGENLTDEVN